MMNKNMGALGNMPQEGVQQAGGVRNIDLDTFMEMLTNVQGIPRDSMTPELVGEAIKNIGMPDLERSLMSELGNRMAGGGIE